MIRSNYLRRSGFSIIEVIVVVAVSATILGIAIPAVQSARESSRRTVCQLNLKQVGLGLQIYQQSFLRLPSTVRLAGAKEPNLSWETQILPYLEEQSLYDKINPRQSWSSSATASSYPISNRELIGTPLKGFQCPSTPESTRLDGDPQDPAGWSPTIGAPTDYSATTRVEKRLLTAGLVDAAGPGVMPANAMSRMTEVVDGVSNTIMLAESAGRPQLWRAGKRVGSLPDQHVNGGSWGRPASDFGVDGSSYDGASFPGVCAINCTNGEDIGGKSFPYPAPYEAEGTGETYAFHITGANVLMADGGVQLLSANVDIRVFAKLVTRASHELVNPATLER